MVQPQPRWPRTALRLDWSVMVANSLTDLSLTDHFALRRKLAAFRDDYQLTDKPALVWQCRPMTSARHRYGELSRSRQDADPRCPRGGGIPEALVHFGRDAWRAALWPHAQGRRAPARPVGRSVPAPRAVLALGRGGCHALRVHRSRFAQGGNADRQHGRDDCRPCHGNRCRARHQHQRHFARVAGLTVENWSQEH